MAETQPKVRPAALSLPVMIRKIRGKILRFRHNLCRNFVLYTFGKFNQGETNIMKPKRIFISILAVLIQFPLMGTFAQPAANSGSIEVITTFDYPGTGNQTLPQKINSRGDIVGVYVDSLGVTRGFVRFSDGSFSAPIVDPNDTVGFTQGRGINNSGTVVGDYAISDGNLHSFFLSDGTFTEYAVPGAFFTSLLSISEPV